MGCRGIFSFKIDEGRVKRFRQPQGPGGCCIDINIRQCRFPIRELAVAGATAAITGPMHNTDIKYSIMCEQGLRMELWTRWAPVRLWAKQSKDMWGLWGAILIWTSWAHINRKKKQKKNRRARADHFNSLNQKGTCTPLDRCRRCHKVIIYWTKGTRCHKQKV